MPDECESFADLQLTCSPVFTDLPADISAGCCGTLTVTAVPSGGCGTITVTSDYSFVSVLANTGDSVNDCFAVGVTIIRFTAVDARGEIATCESSIVVDRRRCRP